MKLVQKKDDIKDRLNKFKSLDKYAQSLDNSTLSIHNANLNKVLDELNDNINYHKNHVRNIFCIISILTAILAY